MIKNPILKGFYPDPSICRADDDFYMVTSSFSYFPGVPVFHSRDLVNWEQIGHVLDRKEQLHVTYEDISLGIFAPTIRYHEGTFYMITTNMTTHENFFCTAKNPAGPWSDPIIIKEAEGIDPSLFFDDDGKIYFTGTCGFGTDQYILCSEIDLKTGQFIGEPWSVGRSAAKNGTSPEAPHIYKRNGWYYRVIAEGGTEHYHAVTVSRSRDIHGPYEDFRGNPILTHRHLGMNYPICNVGHADFVELKDGSWYMVCLGSRLVDGYHKPLGRETFIAPVAWEEDWPVVSPGTGKLEWQYPSPQLESAPVAQVPDHDDFSEGRLRMEWNYLGTPYDEFVSVAPGRLTMKMLPKSLVPWEFEGEVFDFMGHIMKLGHTKESMPFIGKRLKEPDFSVRTEMKAELTDSESSGLVIMQNNAHQLRLEASAVPSDDTKLCFKVMKVVYGLRDGKIHFEETEEGAALADRSESYELCIKGHQNRYDFYVKTENQTITVAENVDGTHLGSEAAGGFVGAYAGVFATANGGRSDHKAWFSYFDLENRS